MTDQKLIAGIFNDFLGLYTGKIQTGIRPLIEKYKSHPMLMGLLSNLDEAAKIQAPKAIEPKAPCQRRWKKMFLIWKVACHRNPPKMMRILETR